MEQVRTIAANKTEIKRSAGFVSVFYPVGVEHNHVVVEVESVRLSHNPAQQAAIFPTECEDSAVVTRAKLVTHFLHQTVGSFALLQLFTGVLADVSRYFV